MGVPPSPVLPKRSARMELDAINNKRPFSQKEKLPEVPEIETGITNQVIVVKFFKEAFIFYIT